MPAAFHTILYKAIPETGEISDFDILYFSFSDGNFHDQPEGRQRTLLNNLPGRAAHLNLYRQIAQNGGTAKFETFETTGDKKARVQSYLSGDRNYILELWQFGKSKNSPFPDAGLPAPNPQNGSPATDYLQENQNLNKELLSVNRELQTLNSELRAFSSIAASYYKETLRKMYTSLEFIIVHDASQLSNEGKANLRRAQSGIQKMKLMTEDIISYSAIEAAPEGKEWVNLNDYLEQVKSVVKDRMNAGEIQIECSGLAPVRGYPTLLYLLFYHLLDNAVKFRSRERKLNIIIKGSRINGLYINHADASPEIFYEQIRLEDNGIGFEQKFANMIFTMFFRIEKMTNYPGSGTGLAFCRKIMQLHDGFITAEGNPGQGAIFHCYFPFTGEGENK